MLAEILKGTDGNRQEQAVFELETVLNVYLERPQALDGRLGDMTSKLLDGILREQELDHAGSGRSNAENERELDGGRVLGEARVGTWSCKDDASIVAARNRENASGDTSVETLNCKDDESIGAARNRALDNARIGMLSCKAWNREGALGNARAEAALNCKVDDGQSATRESSDDFFQDMTKRMDQKITYAGSNFVKSSQSMMQMESPLDINSEGNKIIKVAILPSTDQHKFPPLFNTPILCARILYVLCKIRGRKAVARTLPRDVQSLSRCVELLNSPKHTSWETKYCALVWLSILILLPFDIESILEMDDANRLQSMCESFLNDARPTREPAGLCLARLLTRPDRELHLKEFLISTSATPGQGIGYLQACAALFKRGGGLNTLIDREANARFDAFLSTAELVFMNPEKYQTVERRLHLKLVQRVACKPNVLSIEHANRTERVVDLLLTGLADRDSIVRWSAAKALGRICAIPNSNLSASLCEQVSDALLDVLGAFGHDDDASWHGACLAIAEMCRRRLIKGFTRIDRIVNECIARGLDFDRKRGTRALGSNVRDAACYVSWALVHNHGKSILDKPQCNFLYKCLVMCALFDREVSCRRAAAAALQECVGRLGREKFPKGIETIQIVDFQGVGSLQNTYETLTRRVLDLKNTTTIRGDLIDHLVFVKLRHWDSKLRVLAGSSLETLFAHSEEGDVDDSPIINELIQRAQSSSRIDAHGGLLGCAAVIGCGDRVGVEDALFALLRSSSKRITSIVESSSEANLNDADLDNDEDSQLVAAWCLFVERVAAAGLLTKNHCTDFLFPALVHAAMRKRACRPNAQKSLISILAHVTLDDASLLLQWCEIGNVCASDSILTLQYDGHDNPVVQAACASAAAALKKIIASVTARDYRDRVEALEALSRCRVPQDSKIALEAIHIGLNDQTTTNRGDVGSWVRRAACQTLGMLRARQNVENDDVALDILWNACLQDCAFLACEKLDHVREMAGNATLVLLRTHPNVVSTAKQSRLDFSNLKSSFKACEYLLDNPLIRDSVVRGLALSAGALSESPSEAAKTALARWCLKTGGPSEKRTRVWITLSTFADESKKDETRFVASLKTLAHLLLDAPKEISSDAADSPPWALGLLKMIVSVCVRTKSVHRLVQIGRVMLGLGVAGVNSAWPNFARMLIHEFPVVKVQMHESFSLWAAGVLNPSESVFENRGGKLDLAMNLVETHFVELSMDLTSNSEFENEFLQCCPH